MKSKYEDYITYDNYKEKYLVFSQYGFLLLPDVLYFGNYRTLTHRARFLYSIFIDKLKKSYENGLYNKKKGNALLSYCYYIIIDS